MPRRSRHSSRGASLIDVLIAVTLLTTLLGIGLPSLSRLRSPYAVTGASHQIEAALQAARMRAIARNVRYRVNFTSSYYTVERENAGTFVAEGGRQKLPQGARLGTVSPSNPIFDTRGMLAAQVAVPVMVTGARTRTVTVNVLGKTAIN